MSSLHCPYCELKEASKTKTVFEALQPIDGRCEDCGSFLDIGQHRVSINGYKQIYDGCISLMSDMAKKFIDILEYCDVDLSEYCDDDVEVSYYTTEIIEKLFVPYMGSTTKINIIKALGIENSYINFPIQEKEKNA